MTPSVGRFVCRFNPKTISRVRYPDTVDLRSNLATLRTEILASIESQRRYRPDLESFTLRQLLCQKVNPKYNRRAAPAQHRLGARLRGRKEFLLRGPSSGVVWRLYAIVTCNRWVYCFLTALSLAGTILGLVIACMPPSCLFCFWAAQTKESVCPTPINPRSASIQVSLRPVSAL